MGEDTEWATTAFAVLVQSLAIHHFPRLLLSLVIEGGGVLFLVSQLNQLQ